MKRRNFLQHTLVASTALATNSEPIEPPKKGFKVKVSESRYKERIMYGEVPVDFKLLSSDTDNQLSVFIASNGSQGFGPPMHLHRTFDEFFCILEGALLFQLDDEQFTLQAGDTIFIPRGVKHTFKVISTQKATNLVAILPGKGMENYFLDMAKALDAQGIPDMKAMNAAYAKYDSEIVGPPLK
jgi:mannose-6-phosphate isomerase-like protein (cupin superfamily)